METKRDKARLQVWLPVELLDRIVVAAQEADRPVSREVVRRLEASFGPTPASPYPGEDRSEGRWRAAEAAERAAKTVERLQQQVPGVKTVSAAFPSVPQDLAGPVKPKPRSG